MIMQHGSSYTHNGTVLPFIHSILLWSVGNCQLPPNALLSTKLVKCIGGILTPIIQSKHLDRLSCLVLHKSFELLEQKQDLL